MNQMSQHCQEQIPPRFARRNDGFMNVTVARPPRGIRGVVGVTLLVLGALPVAAQTEEHHAKLQAVPRIGIEEYRYKFDRGEAVAIDVRGTVPYELGHIPGAIHIPLGRIVERFAEIPKDKLLVTYCSCKAEETAAEAVLKLQEIGFENVASLKGGFNEWTKLGLPVDKVQQEEVPLPPPVVMGEPSPARGGRIAPPTAVTCDRNKLTSWTGEITGYKRTKDSTWIRVDTDADTVEETTLNHKGKDDPTPWFLMFNEPFKPDDWKRIESKKGVLLDGMRATIWVCEETGVQPVVDWRPGEAKHDAP